MVFKMFEKENDLVLRYEFNYLDPSVEAFVNSSEVVVIQFTNTSI